MRMVDEVVVGEGHEAGLDFKEHFLRIRPQMLVVTEDDKYTDIKKQLCAQVRRTLMDETGTALREGPVAAGAPAQALAVTVAAGCMHAAWGCPAAC